MLLADALPNSFGPYVAVMLVGFVIGGLGHLFRSQWMIAIGIATILTSIVLFQIAAGGSGDESLPPPTPQGGG